MDGKREKQVGEARSSFHGVILFPPNDAKCLPKKLNFACS
jgi:hypothetical protein